jgi:class 3 adenylate cyclase/ActR/RegA family two-component response regulator
MSMDRAALAHLRHELRTPLNHIIGYSEMLLEDAAQSDPAALGSGLREVHENAQRLLAVISELTHADARSVDFARLSAEFSEPLTAIVQTVSSLKLSAARAGAQRESEDLERIARAASALQSVVAAGGAVTDAPVTEAKAAESSANEGVILIVDDNAGNRELLGRRLEREGHRVQLAENGAEALELLRSRRVDLVLLDVMMPQVDGYEVLRQLKSDEALHDIPVLMISAVDEIESVVRCIELGAEDYLPKPFDPVLLRARIGACLEKKRLRDGEAQHLRELADWNQKLEQRVAEQLALVDRLGRLKRFFSPQLAELIVAGGADDPLKTHRRDVTVVFLDLRGFTAFAETAEPEEVMGVLREYHAEMGKLILEHEGTLERFTGDGMMIFFNDPVPVDNPGERAVRMALAMRERVSMLIDKWRRLGYELDLGIGIAQGFATIGAIGFEGRWDYGAIGSVTNLAARLCGEAKPGQILISKRVLATTDELLKIEAAGELALKGFHRPIPAYNVLGLKA